MILRRLLVLAFAGVLLSDASTAAGVRPRSAAAVPPAAIRVAKTYVAARYHLEGIFGVRALRSRRDPSWALVDGYHRKPVRPNPRLWSAYVHLQGGHWRVLYSGIALNATNPAPRAPCDIWPPFSEPSC